MKPNIRLRVTKVIHETYTPHYSFSHSEPVLRSTLSSCRLVELNGSEIPDGEQQQGLVLFSFPARAVSGTNIGSKGALYEGFEVLVWKPWYEVNLSSVSQSDEQPSDKTPSFSLSQVLGSSENLRTALLCSRFLVLSS